MATNDQQSMEYRLAEWLRSNRGCSPGVPGFDATWKEYKDSGLISCDSDKDYVALSGAAKNTDCVIICGDFEAATANVTVT